MSNVFDLWLVSSDCPINVLLSELINIVIINGIVDQAYNRSKESLFHVESTNGLDSVLVLDAVVDVVVWFEFHFDYVLEQFLDGWWFFVL